MPTGTDLTQAQKDEILRNIQHESVDKIAKTMKLSVSTIKRIAKNGAASPHRQYKRHITLDLTDRQIAKLIEWALS